MAVAVEILGGPVQLTGNPVWIKCTGGSAPAGASNYEILLRVLSEDGKLYGAPFEMAEAPDGNGESLFDISGYVDQPVQAVFQWPVSGAVKSYPTQAFNVQVQVGESYLDSQFRLQESWGATSEVFQLLKGGLSPRQVSALNNSVKNFYTAYLAAGNFLTARPWGDAVHPDQPVKLWFMPVANASATLQITYYYNDGTNDVYSTSITLNTDNLYELNVNPKKLGINMQPSATKRIEYYDVVIVGKSDSRRFQVDWRPCERPVFLLFANTFGGVDDVFFSGYLTEKFVTEGEISYRPQGKDDTVYIPTLLSDKTGQNSWEANTGWKSISTMQYYRDLLISKQAWYLEYNNQLTVTRVIPVIIDTGDYELAYRKDRMFSMQIGFSEAHRSRHSFDNRIM